MRRNLSFKNERDAFPPPSWLITMEFCSHEFCSSCPDRLVCRCLNVTEAELIQAITAHEIRTLRDLKHQTGAGDGCTCCHSRLQEYIERISLAVV